ncbi:MAG: sigma-70 family RNA polymerase sigma factor [Pseudomonadota bacterium]
MSTDQQALAPGYPVEQEPEDKKILDRFFSGERDAIGDLADRYAPRLFSFGLRMCGNSEDAQDMVQDAFLNIVKYLKGFRGETKLRNWIYRLASSACIRRRRGKNQPERELSLEALRPGHEEDGSTPDIPDWSTSPVESLVNEELRERLARAVERLPGKYRLVFNLRDLEGFSTAEVAEMLKLTPQAVKTRLHRARAFLRNELAEYYQGDGAPKGERP